MGHWNRDRDCEPAQLTEYQATVRARMGTSHRERDSSAYRAQKPRPGRPEAGVCYGSLEPITAACVRHLPDGGGNRLWRVGQTSIGDAHNSALRWRARLETATAGLPWSTWRRFGCGWRMTMRTAIRVFADQN